jgi:hypothetical protein
MGAAGGVSGERPAVGRLGGVWVDDPFFCRRELISHRSIRTVVSVT